MGLKYDNIQLCFAGSKGCWEKNVQSFIAVLKQTFKWFIPWYSIKMSIFLTMRQFLHASYVQKHHIDGLIV